jgi:hypothetical protein
MQVNRQSQRLRGAQKPLGLVGAERDGFAKRIDRVDEAVCRSAPRAKDR